MPHVVDTEPGCMYAVVHACLAEDRGHHRHVCFCRCPPGAWAARLRRLSSSVPRRAWWQGEYQQWRVCLPAYQMCWVAF